MKATYSYPFRVIAAKYHLDYGDVLLYTDAYRRPPDKDRRPLRKCEIVAVCRILETLNSVKFRAFATDISWANTEFKKVDEL